jgi:hypothetical protein
MTTGAYELDDPAGGGDWPLVGPDGAGLTEVRYTYLTEDATSINTYNTGYRRSPEGIEMLYRKESVADPSSYYLRPVVAFRMMGRLGADTVLVCSAAGPDVIADDYLSAGQPAVTGIVFVEIGVDGVSGPALADGLRGLGFRHTGQHRPKPVRLREAA